MKQENVAAVSHSMSKNLQCYNCDNLNDIKELFCTSCNFIQPPLNINYFSRLKLTLGFDIDITLLENSYLDLQKLLHPDLYVKKSEIEKNFAFKHSLLVNQAYETLKSPLKRSEYILSLNDIKVNSNDKHAVEADPELLNEIFELQSDIEETTNQKDLKHIMEQLQSDKNHIYDKLITLFEKKDYLAAARLTIKLQFLEKLYHSTIN